jgi:predicted SprT family Zn-dependent metalloprotease
VELAEKVVDTEQKLRETLLHELCHAAAWVVDGCTRACCPPHGAHFRRWCEKGRSVYPHYGDFAGCHSYAIHKKFRYRCTSVGCEVVVGRHSKSVDVRRQVCGACGGGLEFLGAFRRDGTPMRRRRPNAFARFVKLRFARARADMPGASHAEVMKRISEMYRQESAAAGREGRATCADGGEASDGEASDGEASRGVDKHVARGAERLRGEPADAKEDDAGEDGADAEAFVTAESASDDGSDASHGGGVDGTPRSTSEEDTDDTDDWGLDLSQRLKLCEA